MTESETPDLEAQLRDLDAQIQQLTGESTGMTQQLGGRNDGAQDEEDTAAATTNLEEADAILALLHQRRENLLHKLGRD